MQTFDWIVVGNGLAGAALGYELACQGFSVLLLERSLEPRNATRYSYGGIPAWAATTELTRHLFPEGMARHRQLPEEVGVNTHLRELDLLLTIAPGQDGQAIAAQYAPCAVPPQFIAPQEAHALEPHLNPGGIAGALTIRHGHVDPQALVAAYNRGFTHQGGTLILAEVTGLVRIKERVTGILTAEQAYAGRHIALTTGGHTRKLLKQVGISVPLYYTHAELLETPPPSFSLRTLIMPAEAQRFSMERQASVPERDAQWDQPGQEICPPILDSGVVQLSDGRLRIGQISRTLTNLDAAIDAVDSERRLRAAIAPILPILATVPATWHRCLVTFCRDGLPLVGEVPGITGLSLFVGFSSPFVLVPAIAARFAQAVTGPPDPFLEAMHPGRFLPPEPVS